MFIQRLGLQNILSFAGCSVELRNLNVLIGANGSGKSNLIHVLDLMRHLPGDFTSFMINSRGADLWLRLGKGVETGTLEATFLLRGDLDCQYSFSFSAVGPAPVLLHEGLRANDRILVSREPGGYEKAGVEVSLRLDFANKSILGMFRGPEERSVLPEIASDLETVGIYRHFDVGMRSILRTGLPAVKTHGSHLVEDGGNLAEILQDLNRQMPDLNRRLKDLNTDSIAVRQLVRDGRFIVMLEERNLTRELPGSTLSEGTLRFLCLAAILMHPEPPSLVCIEEPERGLHPDAIRIVGDMLLEASKRTQLVVTTHSRELVDCFTAEPEDVLVCEKSLDNETTFRRFGRDELEGWLDEFTLGDVWQRGALGGTRW